MSIPRVFPRCTGALAAFLLSSAAALAAPVVTLSPVVGPPTTIVTVAGTGFGTTEAVDIYFDTTDLCLIATDATGPFEVTPAPGTSVYGRWPRRYSIDGISPRSVSCAWRSRAHSDGMS